MMISCLFNVGLTQPSQSANLVRMNQSDASSIHCFLREYLSHRRYFVLHLFSKFNSLTKINFCAIKLRTLGYGSKLQYFIWWSQLFCPTVMSSCSTLGLFFLRVSKKYPLVEWTNQYASCLIAEKELQFPSVPDLKQI